MPKNSGKTTKGDDLSKPARRLVIEAVWAPADPRDRLYDPQASLKQKAGSLARIIGSFHPILNVGIYIIDIIHRGGGAWLLMSFIIILAAIFNPT